MKINIKKFVIFLVAFMGTLTLVLVSSAPNRNSIAQPKTTAAEQKLPNTHAIIHPERFYSFIIPDGLEEAPREKASDSVLFLRKAGTPLPEPGTDGEPTIRIFIEENPHDLSVVEYYDGDPGADTLGISNGEYEIISVSGKQAYRFITFTGDVIVVIALDKKYLVMHDFGSAYQGGYFQKVLDSLTFDVEAHP